MSRTVSALDDQINETLNRLVDSVRAQLESQLESCRDELIRTANETAAQIAVEAATQATVEARLEAQRELTEVREVSARSAESLKRQLDEARSEAATARQQIDSLTVELDEARKQLDVMRDDVEATLSDIESARRESEVTRFEVNRLAGELRNKDERAAQARRLPDAVRALDEAATFGEVLDTLGNRAGCEAGRAAVFLVKGSRLRAWRTVGFGFPSDSSRLDIDVSTSGPMAEAARSALGVSLRTENSVPEFARTDEPRASGAWPVSVAGCVVAVLYADGPLADKSEEPYWPAFLDVLARHAGRVLEALTVRQAAGLMTGKATGLASSSVSRQSGSIQ